MSKNNEFNVMSLGALAMDVVFEATSLPSEDGFGLISKETLLPGGSAANVSAALAKIGAKVWQAGKIAKDNYGELFKADLIRQGINTDYLVEKPDGVMLHTYIITTAKGEHCIFVNKGDCVLELKASELPKNCPEGMDCFYTDLFSDDAALWLAEEAVKKGIPVVYNMQCAPSFMEICGVGIEKIEKMLSLADMVIGGAKTFEEFCGKTKGEEIAQDIYQRFKPKDGVICTMGSKGALWQGSEKKIYSPVFPVEVKDSTGAGDAFCAGLIFAYYALEEKNIKYAMDFASACAALKCMRKGPRSEAGFSDITELMKKR